MEVVYGKIRYAVKFLVHRWFIRVFMENSRKGLIISVVCGVFPLAKAFNLAGKWLDIRFLDFSTDIG